MLQCVPEAFTASEHISLLLLCQGNHDSIGIHALGRQMTTTETQPISLTSRADGSQLSARNWTKLLQRLAIWVGFLVLLYIVRDFFFTAFMTFLICYYTLLVVGIGMRRLSPDRERTWLRRLLTIGVFFFVPVLLLGIGVLISPHFAAQGRRLSGWIHPD